MIRAKADVIRQEMSDRQWSDLRLADELNVTPNTAKALLNGDPVGSKTIAAALRVFAPLSFDDLFEIGDTARNAAKEAVA